MLSWRERLGRGCVEMLYWTMSEYCPSFLRNLVIASREDVMTLLSMKRAIEFPQNSRIVQFAKTRKAGTERSINLTGLIYDQPVLQYN